MRRFPFYRQPDSMDCGPACLQMIAKYYGKLVPLEELRCRTQIGREGTSLLGISEAAESIGFRTLAAKLPLASLRRNAALPCILFWNQWHFVVLYKVTRKRMHIADPGLGLFTLDAPDFRQRWINDVNDEGEGEGVVLILEPLPKFYEEPRQETDQPRQQGPIRRVLRYILPYRQLIWQLFTGLLIASLFQLVLPLLAQSVVDVGIRAVDIHFVYLVLMAQGALLAGRLAIEFVRNWLLLHISMRISISILTDFLVKLMKLPIAFFDSKKTGDILQRMNDHQRIETFLTGSSVNVLFSTVTLVVFSVVLAFFNTLIFVVFLAASILYGVWVVVFLKRRKQLDHRRFDVASREQGAAIQLIQGMQEIRLNGMERPMRWGWERLQAMKFRLDMSALGLNQWQQSGAFFLNEGKNIFITFLSAKAVMEGSMTLGTMLAVQYIIGQLNSPIEQMIGFIQGWQSAKISLDRLNEVQKMADEEPPEKKLLQELPRDLAMRLSGGRVLAPGLEREGLAGEGLAEKGLAGEGLAELGLAGEGSAEVGLAGEGSAEVGLAGEGSAAEGLAGKRLANDRVSEAQGIRFSRVSFTYAGAGNEPVLRDIDLFIPAGRTTAIVGASGSGKTTLLKLLLRFYEPGTGDIRLNNVPLAAISHKVWRSNCGAVMQESFIFSDSIAKNIAVGVDEVNMSKLDEAARTANLQDFIRSLPLGYHTMIGAEWKGISMGQRQRLLIARAVYRDPAFIFFDEATNSLDANNESTILENLDMFFRKRTVVVVAHRLSTVRRADQIVVLSRGRITERGTHEELVGIKGEYFALVRKQLELGN